MLQLDQTTAYNNSAKKNHKREKIGVSIKEDSFRAQDQHPITNILIERKKSGSWLNANSLLPPKENRNKKRTPKDAANEHEDEEDVVAIS